ncbi:MAG TPA: hypothetical protein VFV02_11265 [Acidimicrobiales bacterium]|nr:hypothetical protein [Acidimicrobiales bacterium]
MGRGFDVLLVLAVVVGVGFALALSAVVALAATTLLGLVWAVLSGPYVGLKSVTRRWLASPVMPTQPAEGLDLHPPQPVELPILPSLDGVPKSGWWRPILPGLVIAGVTFLLDGPHFGGRRRRSSLS